MNVMRVVAVVALLFVVGWIMRHARPGPPVLIGHVLCLGGGC